MLMEAPCGADAQPFDAATAKYEAVVTELNSARAAVMTHSDAERFLQQQGTELLRLRKLHRVRSS